MYIEASSGSTGYKSDLVSKLLSPQHALCMELWYNVYGSQMGSIDIYIKVCFTSNNCIDTTMAYLSNRNQLRALSRFMDCPTARAWTNGMIWPEPQAR